MNMSQKKIRQKQNLENNTLIDSNTRYEGEW